MAAWSRKGTTEREEPVGYIDDLDEGASKKEGLGIEPKF